MADLCVDGIEFQLEFSEHALRVLLAIVRSDTTGAAQFRVERDGKGIVLTPWYTYDPELPPPTATPTP